MSFRKGHGKLGSEKFHSRKHHIPPARTMYQRAWRGRVSNKGIRQDVHVGHLSWGKGVFAKRDFHKGDTVGIITGDIMDEDLFESPHCMDLGDNLVLEPRNVWRVVNHSCEPNCELIVNDDPEDFKIYVEALRNIKKGDHLTVDYEWPAEDAIPCFCGSTRCRGLVVDKRQLSRARKRFAQSVDKETLKIS